MSSNCIKKLDILKGYFGVLLKNIESCKDGYNYDKYIPVYNAQIYALIVNLKTNRFYALNMIFHFSCHCCSFY